MTYKENPLSSSNNKEEPGVCHLFVFKKAPKCVTSTRAHDRSGFENIALRK